jgi:hypothetical protein
MLFSLPFFVSFFLFQMSLKKIWTVFEIAQESFPDGSEPSGKRLSESGRYLSELLLW